MYYPHFGLTRAPFGITPDTQSFYAGGRRGDVLDALSYAITHGEGIVKVVGEVGSGKTMLCRMLQTRLPESVDVVYLSNPRIDPADVIFAIAAELRMSIPTGASRLQVQNALQEFLLQRHAANRRVVVFVEEAQGMPLDTLEEIRLLTNLETERDKLLQIVLFGQPELDTNLAEVRIRQLRERITHSFDLGPLAPDVVGEYVSHRLRAAGHARGDLFDSAALRLLVNASAGLMRRINILADKALLAAFAEGASQVGVRHMRAALADSEYGGAPRVLSRWLMGVGVGATVALLVLVALWVNEAAPLRVITPVVIEEALPPQPVPNAPHPRDDIRGFINNRVATTRDWLLQADGKHFSIQVLRVTADAMKDLERFLLGQESAALLDKFYIYEGQRNGQAVYGVLYSEYSSLAEAKAALESLPAEVKRFKPYARSIRQLRGALEGNGAT